MYVISNTEGRRGGQWTQEFATKGEAALAVREAMGWDEIHLSDSFAADDDGRDGRAWCCYPTEAARDADAEGAHSPRVFEPA